MFIKNRISVLLLLFSVLNAEPTGFVKGKIIDINSQLPLVGANIVIKSTSIGTISDDDGYFSIEDIPNGNYSISVSYIGYKTVYLPDIWLFNGIN